MSMHARCCIVALAISCVPLAHADDVPSAGVAPAPADVAAPSGTAPEHASPSAAGMRPSPDGSHARGSSAAIQLETAQITGNRELPKVMVIVPWKDAEPAELAGRPLNSLVEEVLTPIDRDVMRRTLDYYRLVAPGAASVDDVKQAAEIDTTDQ
jgi:hypothetical protein